MEDDKRRKKLEAAKEKLAAYKKRKSAQKESKSDSEASLTLSETSLCLSPLPLSEKEKNIVPSVKSDSISENIELSNSENDRSLQEIVIANLLPENNSDSSVISLNALEKFELVDSQNVLHELIKQDQFESIKSNPLDDSSSITIKNEKKDNKVSEEVKKLDDLESSNHSTVSLGTSTEYKQYDDKINMGVIEFQDLLSHRNDHINQLTVALQQVLEDRNHLQEQTDYFAQEIADLKEQLVQTTEIIRKNNWNATEIDKNVTDSTSLHSLAKVNFNFNLEGFDDTIRNEINEYIQQKVEEYKNNFESQLKILQEQLESEKKVSNRPSSLKNTEDSISSLPSIDNNDKMIEIDDQLFNATFTQEELNIIADLRTKIFLFINQIVDKYKSNHEVEVKILKDRLENEKVVHDAEIDRLRQLLNSIKSGSTEINDLRQELNEQHSKEMEELRTYFEQRCTEIEKHYSEEIFSQQSRKMSGSSVSELESDILGPSGDATASDSPKKDLANLRHEMQNKYHAELEILREDYDNRLDELKINHENVVQELHQKYQTLIDALKYDLEEAHKTAVVTQEVASSGDFEIAEVVESYERRLQEQVMLAKIDIVSALEQQIQTLVSSSGDDLEWPAELLQLRDRLTEHWNSEIREIKEQHAQEIATLKEDHEKSLARRTSLKSGGELELRKERDNLKKATTNLRHLVAELIKYFTECEDELNNTLVEELLKYGWDKDSTDLNESSQSELDTITTSPRVKRVHFTPDVTGIIDLINETTENLDSSKDIPTEFRTELDLCLSRLKQEANAILSITSTLKTKPLDLQMNEKSSQDKFSSLTRQLITETQQKNELTIQLDELKAYVQNLEMEKQNLEVLLEVMVDKQKIVTSELDNAREKINDLIESGRREIISEGYGENQITDSTTLGGRIASLAELQERARGFLAETDTKGHPLLLLIEELCFEADRIVEDAKKDHEDLVQQVERLEIQMREMTVSISECEIKKNQVENELKEAIDKIWVLRDIVRDLESQIEDKNIAEIEFKNIVRQLEDKINYELKENDDLRNKLISTERESQYQELIRKLEAENQKLKVSSELVGPDGVLKQVKTQLSDFEKTIDKRTKDLESLHTVISGTNCSSPSEDMSIRDQIRPPGSSDDSDLPLEQLARLKDKLLRHARAEDAAMKRIRDLEMQFFTAKQDFDEMQAERDVLQEQLSEQLVLISSLQLRLDDQRLRVESAQKQSNASFEHKIYELSNEIQDYKDEIHKRDMQIQDLKQICEESNKKLIEHQKHLNAASEIEKQIAEQYKGELDRLRNENKALVSKQDHTSISNEVFEDLLADKNADIDKLTSKLNQVEEKLKFYETSLIEMSEPDRMRRQENTVESLQYSGNLDLRRNPNETVFIGGSTFQEKYGDKIHSPFISTEFSTIEKPLPPDIDLTQGIKESGDAKHVRFEDDLEITKLNSKISELYDEIKLKDISIQEYQNKLQIIRKKLEFSNETIKEKTEDFTDEIDSLIVEKKNLLIELAEVKAHLHDKITKLNEFEKEFIRKDKMYDNLAREKLNLENVIKELKDRITEFKDYEDLVATKNKEIFELGKQLAETATQESLKESILQKELKLTALQERITNLEKELEGKLKEVEQYCNEHQETKRTLEEKTRLLEKYEHEYKEKEQKIIELEIYLEESNKKLEIVLEEEKRNDLQSKQSKHEEELVLNQNNIIIEQLKKEIHHLQEYLNEKDKIINQMTVDSNSLHAALEAIQTKIQESGNVVDLKKRLREEQNLSTALYEELKYLKKSIEHYESVESKNAIETLVLLKESIEKEKLTNQELQATKDSLLNKLEELKQKCKIEEENVQKLKQLLEEEKMNSNMIQIQDANLIESMRIRLESLLNENTNEKLLDEERFNFNMIHMKDVNTIEVLKSQIDELLRRENDGKKLLKIERRMREELERQLATTNQQEHALENGLRADIDASHLFGKYLKSESYRKALIFQKRYLLGLLVSYQKSNQRLTNINYILPKMQTNRPINRFRAVVYAIISVHRMQYIVQRWHSGKRIGSSIILKQSQTNTRSHSRPMSQPTIFIESRPLSGNSPPCQDRNQRTDLPLGYIRRTCTHYKICHQYYGNSYLW